MKIYNILFLLIFFILFIAACGSNNNDEIKSPERVENIPKTAFWIGGADGGSWFLVETIDSTSQIVHFKVFNDNNGELIIDKDFKLNCSSTNRINWTDLRNEINSFDGERILLKVISKEKRYCYFE